MERTEHKYNKKKYHVKDDWSEYKNSWSEKMFIHFFNNKKKKSYTKYYSFTICVIVTDDWRARKLWAIHNQTHPLQCLMKLLNNINFFCFFSLQSSTISIIGINIWEMWAGNMYTARTRCCWWWCVFIRLIQWRCSCIQ